MAKVPHPCKHHREPVFIGSGNHFTIANGAARLHDRNSPDVGENIDAVTKREKGI